MQKKNKQNKTKNWQILENLSIKTFNIYIIYLYIINKNGASLRHDVIHSPGCLIDFLSN